jgi:hypothetical protein
LLTIGFLTWRVKIPNYSPNGECLEKRIDIPGVGKGHVPWRILVLCVQKFFLFCLQATRHLFIPAEKKIPKIRIETRQAEKLTSQRIIVVIDSWPRTSRYPLVILF